MISTVFGVSQGNYADYRIVAVCEREEDAQKAVADGLGDGYEPLDFISAGGRWAEHVTVWTVVWVPTSREWRHTSERVPAGSEQDPGDVVRCMRASGEGAVTYAVARDASAAESAILARLGETADRLARP